MRKEIAVCIAAGLFALAGCNEKQAASPEKTQTAAAPTAAPAPAASAQAAVPAVDSVMISRPNDAPDAVVIAASGTVDSTGWSEPQLVPVEDASGGAAIKSYRFVAKTPATPDAMRTTQPIDATLRIDGLPKDVNTIRVVSATNEVSAILIIP